MRIAILLQTLTTALAFAPHSSNLFTRPRQSNDHLIPQSNVKVPSRAKTSLQVIPLGLAAQFLIPLSILAFAIAQSFMEEQRLKDEASELTPLAKDIKASFKEEEDKTAEAALERLAEQQKQKDKEREEAAAALAKAAAEQQGLKDKARYEAEAAAFAKAAVEAKATEQASQQGIKEEIKKAVVVAQEESAAKKRREKWRNRPVILRAFYMLWRLLQKIIAPWRKWENIA